MKPFTCSSFSLRIRTSPHETATLLVVIGLTAVLVFLCCAAGSSSHERSERSRLDRGGQAPASSRRMFAPSPRLSAVTSAPSPRSLATGPSAEPVGRQLILSSPSQWVRFGGLYSTSCETLPVDELSAIGSFELGRVNGGKGGSRDSVAGSGQADMPLFASVTVGASGHRELALAPTRNMMPIDVVTSCSGPFRPHEEVASCGSSWHQHQPDWRL